MEITRKDIRHLEHEAQRLRDMHRLQINGSGYVPLGFDMTARNLRLLLRQGEAKEGDHFFDMGAGMGICAIAAAHLGFNAFGIEINQTLCECAEKMISYSRENGFIQDDVECKVVNGSFFPNDYVERRKRKETVVRRYENGIFLYGFDNGEIFEVPMSKIEAEEKLVFRKQKIDTEDALGISLRAIDVFFSYSWGVQMPSQLEIFSLYAKKDAVFMNSPERIPKELDALLDELQLEGHDHKVRGLKNYPYSPGSVIKYTKSRN